MDALIYTIMSGAERALHAQQVHANNLANIETGGFRADLELAMDAPVTRGYGYDARQMTQLEANAVSSREGAKRETGRDLDVAISGQGYFVVQWKNGEAYTRDGNFTVTEDGTLTLNGHAVLGDGGPVVLPEYSRVAIGEDGTISVQAVGQAEMQAVNQLKRVRPAAEEVTKNAEGFIVSRSGEPLAANDTVVVHSGHLEGSNVSAVEEMVATMNLNRDFEVQMKLFHAADAMAESGNRVIRE
jgi:flagellar basal-body rod protein FlgF